MRALLPGQLSERDCWILLDLARVRLLTGAQLERLHFSGLASANARSSARRRSLGRLARLGLVSTLPRRVGGVRAGSAGLVYVLDARAQRERPLWDPGFTPENGRIRRPWAVGWRFVQHSLDVAELYVQARERELAGGFALLRYDAEPASWFETSGRTPLKPDAHLVAVSSGWERHWWIEVDRATESLPTIRRKLAHYQETLESGLTGPDGVLPRVLLTAPTPGREAQLAAVARELDGRSRAGQDEAEAFVVVAAFDRAMGVMAGDPARPPPSRG